MKFLEMRFELTPDARHKFVSALLVRMLAQLRRLLEICLEPVLYALEGLPGARARDAPQLSEIPLHAGPRRSPQTRFDSPGAQARVAPLDIRLALVLYAVDIYFLVRVHAKVEKMVQAAPPARRRPGSPV